MPLLLSYHFSVGLGAQFDLACDFLSFCAVMYVNVGFLIRGYIVIESSTFWSGPLTHIDTTKKTTIIY